MVKRWAVSLFGMAAATTLTATSGLAACTDLMPPARPRIGPRRDVTARDLIRLRNVGAVDGSNAAAPSPLGLSPDGRRVAFVIDRSDPDVDDYCQALVVLDLGSRHLQVIDTGGERMIDQIAIRGAIVPNGSRAVVTPYWSPDGRQVGFLKRLHGEIQLWVADGDGGGARQVSDGASDVERWAWAPDSGHVIVASRPGRAAAATAIIREGREGYLYDARIWPDQGGPRPMPKAGIPLETFVADLVGGKRMAQDAERKVLEAAPGSAGGAEATDARGWRAFTEHEGPSPLSPSRIKLQLPNGHPILCASAACSDGVVALWWHGTALLFLRREGWDKEETALYRWRPGGEEPRRVLATHDVLLGCVFAAQLVCTTERSARPRRIVTVNPSTGRMVEMFDPNPEFRNIRLGRVQRLRTVNMLGLKGWADLVLPPRYVPGTKLPTVLVQYHSRGFLRGGTGDEYPIFLFAARGYAVLSLEQPPNVAYAHPELSSWDALNAVAVKNWSERRSLLSSVQAALAAAIDKGVVDPARVGITGLSDGATTVQFALINTRQFAAAAISSCCTEPKTVMTMGIAWADWNRRVMGYPPATRGDPAFWAPISLSQNSATIGTPLLLQLADREYLQSLEAFTALREKGQPVEMFVFPDEYHFKVSSAHRLAVYQRNLDWFDFWLRNRADPDPAKQTQYARWRAMKVARPSAS